MPSQSNLLDGLHVDAMRDASREWAPPETLPDLSRHSRVFFDFETNGLEWWKSDRPIGLAVRAGSQGWYLPFGHRGGGNLGETKVKEWAQRELRNKHLVGINVKFDVNMSRAWGVDLAGQGCTFGDVAHSAALLDDHRQKFNQEILVRDFLGEEGGKVKRAHGFDLDPTKFADYPAGIVAQRALDDVETVERLRAAMAPRLEAEGLTTVAQLEQDVIPVVCEMEWNGAPLDIPLLERMVAESQRHVERICRKIYDLKSLRFRPTNNGDWEKLLNVCGVEITQRTKTGQPSLEDAHLKTIADPVIQMARHARNIESLRSKFLVNYLERVGPDGVLRYDLHQLRAQADAYSEGALGTVSGRFSSANPNIQQVYTTDAQKAKHLLAFLVRKLFVPRQGVWLSADMQAVEYRLFSHYANNPTIIKAYADDPWTDYHDIVRKLLSFVGPRRQLKILNFSQLYGAGLAKFADMLGLDLEAAKALRERYFEMMPEVRPLLGRTSSLAMPTHGDRCSSYCRGPHRGYVRTLLGRRARFHENDRHYSALNRIIQGGAADLNKMSLVAVYRERKALGLTMRNTVHDELNADLHNPERKNDVADLLNQQRFPLRVPILWQVGTGANWAEAK